MFRVRVKFDLNETKGTVRLEGEALKAPTMGQSWGFIAYQNSPDKVIPIQVDLGVIEEINYYRELWLVRTDMIVAEVWFLSDPPKPQDNVAILKNSRPVSVFEYLKNERVELLQ